MMKTGDQNEGSIGFAAEARRSAVAWKLRTPTLRDSERVDAAYRGRGPSYPFCIPVAAANRNLLPDARAIALERFAAGKIQWHDELHGGPSNHLLSSQVQCVNCLAPFVDRPAELATILGEALPIREVVPFGARTDTLFDRDDHVVFEWIGTRDYLGERANGGGSRGAKTTSADAAIRYVNHDGEAEVALIEWKYTERYLGSELAGDARYMNARKERYRALWSAADGPLKRDLIPYDDLFVDPFYQLMRLQLLASEMEKDRAVRAKAVRLLVVAPSRNLELAESFNRWSQRTLGSSDLFAPADTIWESWRAMQRRPDRFAVLDSAVLIGAGAPTSPEFKDRYGHLALNRGA